MALYTVRPEPMKYLEFLGRISPEKRVDRAFEIAKRLDILIKIAANVDAIDHGDFEDVVERHLSPSG